MPKHGIDLRIYAIFALLGQKYVWMPLQPMGRMQLPLARTTIQTGTKLVLISSQSQSLSQGRRVETTRTRPILSFMKISLVRGHRRPTYGPMKIPSGANCGGGFAWRLKTRWEQA